MKTVIEKVILTYFGKFINGIHKDKLSIDLFNGNFQLENISLNQEYFNSLNTPFKLTYSSIGKLNLQASVMKLSSTPVQCTLDNIYAVFQFRSDKDKEQEISAEKLMQDKRQQIQKYIRDMFEEYLKKLREKDDKKQDGTMAKLGKKIIDNLQLKIINFHVRFEQNKNNQKYAWGVTLEQISFMTTDSEWKPTFVDRLAEGKTEKLLKKMNLKNLSVYWQSGSKEKNDLFISELESAHQKRQKMALMVKDSKYSIISLTSEVKLIINQSDNLQLPMYQLSVNLEPIVFSLERVQVSQMIDFTQKNISQNEQILKNLSLKKKKSKKAIENEQKIKLQQNFHEYVQFIVDNHEAEKQKQKIDQQFDHLQVDAILKAILHKVEDEQILLWATKPIRRKVKETRERELKKKKKGWFGGEYQLTEEQTKALSNFVEEVTESNQKDRPPECIFFSLKVMIEGGKFSFVNNKGLPQQQTLQFEIGKISVFLQKSQNDAVLDLTVGVQSISLNLFLPIYGSNQQLKMNIMRNLKEEIHEQQFFDPGEDEQKFISVKFSKRVEQSQKPIIKTDIIGEVKQIAITYKKVFMKKFKSFFTFTNFNESMKNQTMKKWQQMKQKNQDKNAQIQDDSQVVKMFSIQVKITSPLFVCPLTQTGGWCINLGKLSLESSRDYEKQTYPIKVQSAFFRYYPNLNLCLKKMSQAQLNQRQIFCLVKDINFNVTYENFLFVKKSHTSIVLPSFEVNFTEKQYKNLISLKDVFQSGESESHFFEVLKKQRLQIEKNKVYSANIQKKSGDLGKWRSFYGILSGEFIHLYGSEKQLKCLQTIPIKNMRIEYNQETKIITLAHQQGIIELTGSQFEDNSKQWKNRIQLQMKQFMTIYQIVEQMIAKDQLIQTPRKRAGTGSMQLINSQRETSLSFYLQKIGFNFKDDKNKDLMIFRLHGLVFQQKQQNKISHKSIKIQKLYSFDYIHIYKDKTLQALISTNQINIKIIRSKLQEHKKLDIEINFSQININWKPDVLVILMKLVYSYISKEVNHRVDDGQQKTRQQLFQEVLQDPKFSFFMKQYERNSQGREVKNKRINFVQKNKRLKQMIRLNLTIAKTEVLMIHRQSHLIMFKMTANGIDNELAMGENQKFVSGSIKSLQLFEMTGYPKVNYSQQDKNIPYLIIKPRFPDSQQSLVQYKWSSYEPFVLPNSQRVNMFMHITINPIECHYFQQITFRLIDYILIQIILLLNQPEMVVANQNLLEQMKKTSAVSQNQVKKQSQAIVKILFSEFEEVIRKIIDPYFIDMYFELKNPSVLLKPQKNSKFYHRADLKNIIFVNEDRKNSKRFEKCQCPQVMKYIYEETYEIICNECHFYSVKEQQNQNVSNSKLKLKEEMLFNPVDISLSVNKLIMQDQINVIYPELNTYDRSFQTSTSISKLTIRKLTRQQYLLINKLVNFNMVYDDNKDQYFIHNFKITKLLSPKPISYELNIPQISLTGKQGNLDSDYSLFTMNMDGFKLVYHRSADLNSMFKIYLQKANVVGYQYDDISIGEIQYKEKQEKKGQNMIMMMKENIQSVNGSKLKEPKKIELMEFKAKSNQECCADITIKMKTSGQKIIQMNIQIIEAFLKLHLMQLILDWCLLEDWVFPTVSIYANDITFHLTIHKMQAWLKQTFNNYSQSDPRAFKLLGVFCYKFHRKANFSQQHIEQLLKKNELSFEAVNKMPQTSYMTVLLNTEIFHCLASGNLHTKRQVVQKITFNLIQKSFFKVANEKLFKIKTMTNRKMNLDKGLFKFSFTDILLMRDILGQISKDRQYIGKIRQITNPTKKVVEVITDQHDTELSSLQNLDIEIQSLSLYLINNCREAFIPILRLHINNAFLSKCNTIKKQIFKANFETAAYYFNATIFRWEPMIQKVDLSMSKITLSEQQEHVFTSIQAMKPLLVNVSKQMIAALRDALDEWNKRQQKTQMQPRKKMQIKQSTMRKLSSGSSTGSPKKHRNVHETVQLVSQYVIRNQIGYPIEIYGHYDKKLMYRIQNLQQIDYQYQLQKYDDENQIEILIGIEILHKYYKFKRITHISLGLGIDYIIVPELAGKTKLQTIEQLPKNSTIHFITQTKDSKRYLILKTSKWVQDYLHNIKDITYLPFDHKETILLPEHPHNGNEVSLYKSMVSKEKNQKGRSQAKYRYIADNGVLKIMGRAMVYNYTPIPLLVNGFYLLPDQFVTIQSQPTVQSMRFKECKGVKIKYDDKNQIYYIYCDGYIIDYAGLYYQIVEAKQFSYQGINKGLKYNIYLLADAESKIKVRLQKNLKSTNYIKCSALIRPAVGNQIFQLQNHSNALCEYTTYGYLSSYTGNEYKDFKKIIQVTPRYVLSNTTNYNIKICQMQSQQSFMLQPGQRIPFFWQNKSKPKQIKIAALRDNTMFGYSGPLSIQHNTHSFVVRNSCNVQDYRILSLQLQSTNTINFVHIIDCHPKKGNNIMLCNHFQGGTLRFFQDAIFKKDYEMQNPIQYSFIVRPGQELPFGYEVPLQKHQIRMEILFDQTNPRYAGLTPIKALLEDIENNLFQKKIDIITRDNKRKSLLLKLSFEGNVKKLQLMHFSKSSNQIKQGQFICKIPTVLVSLIGYQQKIRKQVITVQVNGIELESSKTNKTTEYNFTIKDFQIENCLKTKSMFPVILQVAKPSKPNQQFNFFLQFMLTKDNFNSKLIHYIGISINKFVLQVTSQQIQCLQQTITDITNVLKDPSVGKNATEMREYEMFMKPNPEINESLYFINAQILPLKMNVTFKHVNNWGGRVFKTFASIDNCNLSVDGKKISHFSSRNISQFFDHLRKHYQQGITKVIIPMIGNLAILGSPVSLAQRIGSGFKDLIQLPAEGFNNGALQGGKGLARGAGSLVKNTFEGTLNTVESVTGSVGNGLSSLAFDDEFMKQRQKIKNDRSSHIGQGLANGAKSIANGFARGFTGLFTAPVEGAQQSGIGGFFIGGLKGISGLVVKPVSGIFDATTQTFQGIKNTPSYLQRQSGSESKLNRRRNPRAFYTNNRQFRSYDEDISMSAKIIAEKDEQKFENLSWYGFYHLATDQKDKKNPLLLVTHEYIIIYNLADNVIFQTWKSSDILDAIHQSERRVKIALYDDKKKRVGHITLQLRQPMAVKLTNEIKSICNTYRPIYGYDYHIRDNGDEFTEKSRSARR